MTKDEISRISLQMLNGKNYGVPIIDGDPNELLAMAMCAASSIVKNEPPYMRKAFRTISLKILRDTRPEWMNTAAVYCVGVAVLFGLVAIIGNGMVLIAKGVGLW